MHRQLTCATLLAISAGCHQPRPEVPAPKAAPDVGATPADLAAAWRWQIASPVNRAIDRLFDQTGLMYYYLWQISGPVAVVENDQPAIYQALVVETVFDSRLAPVACRPRSLRFMIAWRVRRDSTGIDAYSATFADDGVTSQADLGPRLSCGRSTTPIPSASSYGLAGPIYYDGREADEGTLVISRAGPTNTEAPCRLAAAYMVDLELCERRDYLISMRGHFRRSTVHGPDPADPGRSVQLESIGSVPGIRVFARCANGSKPFCLPGDSVAATWLPRRGQPGFLDRAKFTAEWNGRRVRRSEFFIRLNPSMTESQIGRFFGYHMAQPHARGHGDQFLVSLPDPGPGALATGRLLHRIRGLSEVRDVFPVLASEPLPAVPPGRFVARLRDRSGEPIVGVRVCPWFANVGGMLEASCRRSGSDGIATFDSLAAIDIPFFADCRPWGGTTTIAFDSTVVAVRPDETVNAEFRAPWFRCDARPFVQHHDSATGLLWWNGEDATFLPQGETTPLSVPSSTALIGDLGPEDRTRGLCLSVTLNGTRSGPSVYGRRRLAYQLLPSQVTGRRQLAVSACQGIAGTAPW